MKDENFYYDLIESNIKDRIDNCTYQYLMECSKEYKELDLECLALINEYPIIYKITDGILLNNEIVSKNELIALQKYWQNHVRMESLEREVVYKSGFRDSIKLFMCLHLLKD